ncbi:HAD family hydrolase [Neobacillus notoginsengisoli]|uniref:HAD family hydrolase n=1 Tax=Neobacillus notoginsengisoli TaxID=1578198 RepID=A0A417YPD9_9BACI|nr:HAD family hydrolase [Neobacillus notoginsengisoli]RHW35694.1 HAD family hydrolase [Neobacillus notoginsengisoli]
MIKGIVFDFDGLIVDTESLWFEAYQEIMKEFRCDLTLEEFSKVIGTTDEQLNEFFELTTGMTVDEAGLHVKTRDFYHQRAGSLELREGVREFLDEARELNLKIGLASSSGRDWVESYLKKFEILEYFETIKTKEDVEKVKPDPALYVKALAALGIRPEETIAFEDSLNGSAAAIAAGMHCVIVPNPVTNHLPFENYRLKLISMAEKSLAQVIKEVEAASSTC